MIIGNRVRRASIKSYLPSRGSTPKLPPVIVRFIIWPYQQKVLGLLEASADARVATECVADMTSNINACPMLYCMVAQQNTGL
jgi:hypothetical protein